MKNGKPRKHVFNKNDPIFTNNKEPTNWTFIKEAGIANQKRKIMVRCSCGEIKIIYLSDITTGNSNICRRCEIHSRTKNPNNLVNSSLSVGRNKNYFSAMKRKYPNRFEKILALGLGNLIIGYQKEQDRS